MLYVIQIQLKQLFSQELLLCGCFPDYYKLNVMSKFIIIYPPYTHNLHFLKPPLELISKISFIRNMLKVTIYLDWLSGLVYSEPFYKKHEVVNL